MNSVPTPCSLFTEMEPFIISTIFWVIAIPKPLYLDSADCRVLFPFKRLKDMFHKFSAHADSGILDMKFIVSPAASSGFLYNPHADNAPAPYILRHCSADLKIPGSAEAYRSKFPHLSHPPYQCTAQLFCMNICLHNITQPMKNIRQTAGLLLQMHLAALNTAHIQYIVNKAQQMVS